ncbi:hypothetical protein B0H14DRAFT_3444150 [Mycena olivaceomarginata]|nr:hypothetical protein B0H14DRAFT_3444150 [Mycena olivaceomarginata]
MATPSAVISSGQAWTIVPSLPDDTVLAVLARLSLAHPTTSSPLPRSQSRHRLHHRRQTQDTEYPSSSTTTTSPPYGAPPHGHIYIQPAQHHRLLNAFTGLTHFHRHATPISALHGRLLAFLAPSPAASPVLSGTGAAPLVSWGHTLGRFFSHCAPVASALSASVFSGGEPAVACVARLYGGSGRGCGERLGEGGGSGAAPETLQVARLRGGAARVSSSWRDGLGASVRGHSLCAPLSSGTITRTLTLPPRRTTLLPAPTHVYALRRGLTGAVVESVADARDGRLIWEELGKSFEVAWLAACSGVHNASEFSDLKSGHHT